MNYALLACAFLLGIAITMGIIALIWLDPRRTKEQETNRSANFWQKLQFALMLVQALWYPILIFAFTTYIVLHYPDCMEFTFFSNFQGDNIVFLVWLLMLVLPVFSKLGISGITIEFWGKSEFSKYIADKAKDIQHIATIEELEKERNQGKEDSDGKQ